MPTLYDRTLARMTRRELLNIAWKLGTAAAITPTLSRGLWAQPVFRDDPFTLGVASGDPRPDGVVLWTRLAPEPLAGGGMPMVDVEVAWEVATDDRFRTSSGPGSRSRGPNSVTRSMPRSRASSPAATTGTASMPATR